MIDPGDGRVVAPGTEGELVFTTLTKEALPLLRYRTGDIGCLAETPCACGRTTARLTGLRGRHDDMLIVRGVNIHPSQVEHLLLGAGGVAPHYRLIVERPGPLDELTLECEPDGTSEDPGTLRARLEQLLREHTGLRITVTVAQPGNVPRSEGKAVRVVDRRPGRDRLGVTFTCRMVCVPGRPGIVGGRLRGGCHGEHPEPWRAGRTRARRGGHRSAGWSRTRRRRSRRARAR